MARLNLLDGSGWFDLMEAGGLNADHQDEYWDMQEDVREKKRALLPPPGPDPANPAVMAPEPVIKMTRKDVKPIQDLVAGWVVQGTSFAGVLPWDAGSRTRMPLAAWNALREAFDPFYDILNGEGPKETPAPDETTSATSSTTSPDAAPAPQQEQPSASSEPPAGS
jgi:hypothetical protein